MDVIDQLWLEAKLKELEARILRKLAKAIRCGFVEGYHSHGGPQDGDSTSDSFDTDRAAKQLEADADAISWMKESYD